MDDVEIASAEDWLLLRVGLLPKGSLGWFRAGVGFYNKKHYTFSIECFERAVAIDPLNFNAYQIMARACIAVNRRDDGRYLDLYVFTCEVLSLISSKTRHLPPCFIKHLTIKSQFLDNTAITALKQSVKLNNPSDWQLLVELTSLHKADTEVTGAATKKE